MSGATEMGVGGGSAVMEGAADRVEPDLGFGGAGSIRDTAGPLTSCPVPAAPLPPSAHCNGPRGRPASASPPAADGLQPTCDTHVVHEMIAGGPLAAPWRWCM